MRCAWCDRQLEFVDGYGWAHIYGNTYGIYWQKCQDCGHEFASRGSECPMCRSRNVIDLHAALPYRKGRDEQWV